MYFIEEIIEYKEDRELKQELQDPQDLAGSQPTEEQVAPLNTLPEQVKPPKKISSPKQGKAYHV